jgi:glycosyltransferase involved in cell wall biosynthesis
MRVGANLMWLVPGVVGGSEEYSVRLLEAWARRSTGGQSPDDGQPDAVELVLFVDPALPAAYPDLVSAFPTVIAPKHASSKGARVLLESTWLTRQARSERLDLVHHLGGTMPVVRLTPGLVTIHDLQPFVHPHHFSLAKRSYLHATVPTSVRQAEVVITLSNFTRHDVIERMGVDPGRVVLVPPGLDRPTPVEPQAAERVRHRHGLAGRPYFLYPAITYAHKNHVMLIRAFAQVAAAHPEPMLVLTGGVADAESDLMSEIERLGLGSRVVRTGRVSVAEFNALFASATALTFPSRYEGFGMPALEAMSRGVAVIASSNTALPEVLAGAGLLLDPDDGDGWAGAMAALLDDAGRRTGLVELGHRRAAEFDWDASERALARAYHQARQGRS